MHKFTIYGKAQAKQRPRFTKGGHIYTPQETLQYENVVRYSYIASKGKCYENALKMRVVVFYATKYKNKKGQYRIERPDLSNIVKSIEDGLNGVAYKDDAQIVVLEAEKRYGDEFKVEVEISEV